MAPAAIGSILGSQRAALQVGSRVAAVSGLPRGRCSGNMVEARQAIWSDVPVARDLNVQVSPDRVTIGRTFGF